MKQIFSQRFLNNFSIKQKMMLIFIGCVIIPFFIQNVFYVSAAEKNIQNEMLQRLKLSLSEKTNKVNGCITGTMSLVLRYNANELLYKFLDTSYAEEINYLTEYQNNIRDLLLSDLAYNQQAFQLTLYSDNPTIFNGALVKRMGPDEFDTFGEKLLDYRLDALTTNPNGPKLRVSLIPKQLTNPNDRSLSIIRPLKYFPQYSNYQKALRIDINLSYISSILRQSDLFDNIVLVDSDNRIIASANTYPEYGAYDVFSEDALEDGIVMLKQPLADVPLSLYGFYDSSIISREFNQMRFKTILIGFGSLLLAFFFILMVAGNITKRTRLVVNLSKNIARGIFDQISQDKTGRDEIGVLADSINQMSLQLQTLIDEEYNSRIIKAQLERETVQAKLLALQSQVDPHFMFNALESIRLKAVVKNETETAKMIMYLSKMFRHLINWEDDIIPLSKDMKFLEEFLFIQQYRFEDEFEYEIIVENAADNCLLPKLIIQPLVENACVHGVESVSHKGRVVICITGMDDQMLITVSDNGIGIDEIRLADLKRMFGGGQKLTHSVGLYNVYQRLSLYYGTYFTMDIQSRENDGTQIQISIPIRYSKEEF